VEQKSRIGEISVEKQYFVPSLRSTQQLIKGIL